MSNCVGGLCPSCGRGGMPLYVVKAGGQHLNCHWVSDFMNQENQNRNHKKIATTIMTTTAIRRPPAATATKITQPALPPTPPPPPPPPPPPNDSSSSITNRNHNHQSNCNSNHRKATFMSRHVTVRLHDCQAKPRGANNAVRCDTECPKARFRNPTDPAVASIVTTFGWCTKVVTGIRCKAQDDHNGSKQSLPWFSSEYNTECTPCALHSRNESETVLLFK